MPVPQKPSIYHIVHVDNLRSIVNDGFLWPDAVMVQREGAVIGNQSIKSDRLKLPVACHPQTFVGDYVPFYWCPRSVMLYVISKRNHPNLAYRDGQDPVIHFEADLGEVVEWARAALLKWAFTDINAANRAADFYNDLQNLEKINWDAIGRSMWQSCRDHKMAEFLMHTRFPWTLVRVIGVHSEEVGRRAIAAFAHHAHRPEVRVMRNWYY